MHHVSSKRNSKPFVFAQPVSALTVAICVFSGRIPEDFYETLLQFGNVDTFQVCIRSSILEVTTSLSADDNPFKPIPKNDYRLPEPLVGLDNREANCSD